MTLRIILTFRNARPWLGRCVESLFGQSCEDWHCTAVDDCSNDDSGELVRVLTAGDPRFTHLTNNERLYQCGSTRRALANPGFADQDICIALDGDDFLPDRDVFRRVHEAYADGQTWVTWGSEIRTDGVPDCNAPLADAARVREVEWCTSHLRTWKLFLWRRIRPEDFLGPTGEPLRVGGDLASMYPMIEMAGNAHAKYLESINYVYNRDNPLSNFRVRTREQLAMGVFLQAKPAYAPLPETFESEANCSAVRQLEPSTPQR